MFIEKHFVYKQAIILSLYKITTLNFILHILTILKGQLKTYVNRLYNR